MGHVIVTGGSGFIGTHLVDALLADGRRPVVNLDIRPPVKAEHRSVWRQVDLLDREHLVEQVRASQPEAIVNLAAEANILAAGDAFAVNTRGLRNLLDANNGLVTPARVLHTSTQFVARPGYLPSGPRDLAPYTEYGETKAKSEGLMWDHGGPCWTVIRPTVVWGPGNRVMAIATMRYLKRRLYVLPKGTEAVRSYGYVGNVVAQVESWLQLARDEVHQRVVYVGDPPVSSALWLDAVATALTGRPVRRVPFALFRGAATAGEALKKVGGPAPLDRGRLFRMTTDAPVPMEEGLALLGRGPTTLQQGVDATVRWLRETYPETFG